MTSSKLMIALISPLGTALLLGVLALAVAGLAGRASRARRWAPGLAALALCWLWAWSTPGASHALRGALEAPYPLVPVANLPQAPAVVVLGGGVGPPAAADSPPNLHAAADRVWHAARLYHAGKAPLVVASGGADPTRSAFSEAAAMARLLQDLGVPAAALLEEGASRNTAENARFTAELLRARGIGTVLLVTSALHMPRARLHFESAGLEVLPAATDHEAEDTTHWPLWRRWLPDADALQGSARALKEWVANARLRA